MNPTQQSLAEQMRITEHEIERRLLLMGLCNHDETLLREHLSLIEPHIESIVKRFYEKQTNIPEISLIIGDSETLANLHRSMSQYIYELFSGEYGFDYVNKRLRIGKVHQRIGVSPKLYLTGINQLQAILEETLTEVSERSVEVIDSLRRLFYFDNQLVFDTYIAALQNEVQNANDQLSVYAQTLEKKVVERTQALTELSLKDPLTDLYNQRAFQDFFSKYFSNAERTGNDLTVLYIDLNKFKQVNDTLGHRAGDDVLIAFAESCRATLRSTEVSARYGGDEFCILLPNTKIENIDSTCRRLFADFDKRNNTDVTLSVGGASYFSHCDYTSDELLQLADKHMYLAKQEAHQHGGHRVSLAARDSDNIAALA